MHDYENYTQENSSSESFLSEDPVVNDSTCSAESLSADKKLKAQQNMGLSFFLQIAGYVGFLLVMLGVCLRFLPIGESKWIALGVGKVVLFGAILGVFFTRFKNNFASFFVSLFILFFLFNETIVFYDGYAINLGKELTNDGVYRSVLEIFSEAFKPFSGASLVLFGGLLGISSSIINWILAITKANKLYEQARTNFQ